MSLLCLTLSLKGQNSRQMDLQGEHNSVAYVVSVVCQIDGFITRK